MGALYYEMGLFRSDDDVATAQWSPLMCIDQVTRDTLLQFPIISGTFPYIFKFSNGKQNKTS